MMQRSKEEKAAVREQFRQLPFRQKAEHIFIYYKWYIILGVILLAILGSVFHRVLTKKERILYLGLANVSIGSDLEREFSTGFLEELGLDTGKTEVLLYRDLYFSDNAEGEAHKSAYASRIKLMASVEGRQLDAIVMSGQAYDLLSAQGYLLDMTELLAGAPDLSAEISRYLTENEVTLEDNSIEYQLGSADELVIKTESVTNGVCLTELPRFSSTVFLEPVYLGFLANTPRRTVCLDFLRYLLP